MVVYYKDLPLSKVKTAQFKSVEGIRAGDILVIEEGDIPQDKRFLFDIMFTTHLKKIRCDLERYRDGTNEVYEFKSHS